MSTSPERERRLARERLILDLKQAREERRRRGLRLRPPSTLPYAQR